MSGLGFGEFSSSLWRDSRSSFELLCICEVIVINSLANIGDLKCVWVYKYDRDGDYCGYKFIKQLFH